MRTIEVATDNTLERSASAVECKGLDYRSQEEAKGRNTRVLDVGARCLVLG
jgi:hypothetical protein